MGYRPYRPPKEMKAEYRSIYLRREIADAVMRIAIEENMSFNRVVVSMIEYCLTQQKEDH